MVMFTAPLNGVRVGWFTLCDVVLAAAVAATAASPEVRLRARSSAMKSPVLAGLALMTVGALIGTVLATDPYASLLPTIGFVLTGGSMVALMLWAPTGTDLRWLCGLWVAGAVASALWAMLGGPTLVGRRLGLASHPNSLGLASVLGMGVAVGLLFGRQRALRVLAGPSAMVLIAGVVASGSRAALLGAVAVVPAVALLCSRWRFAAWSAAAAVMVAGAVLVGVVHASALGDNVRLVGDRSTVESDVERLGQLSRSLDRIKGHPLSGAGFAVADEAHNIYLQALVAAGPLGLLGLGVVTVSVVGAARREILAAGHAATSDVAMLAGLAGGFVGYMLGAAFQNSLSERYVWLYLAGTVALTGALKSERGGGRTADHEWARSRIALDARMSLRIPGLRPR